MQDIQIFHIPDHSSRHQLDVANCFFVRETTHDKHNRKRSSHENHAVLTFTAMRHNTTTAFFFSRGFQILFTLPRNGVVLFVSDAFSGFGLAGVILFVCLHCGNFFLEASHVGQQSTGLF